jgi:hypothetical protein
MGDVVSLMTQFVPIGRAGTSAGLGEISNEDPRLDCVIFQTRGFGQKSPF